MWHYELFILRAIQSMFMLKYVVAPLREKSGC